MSTPLSPAVLDSAIRAHESMIDRYERDLRESPLRGDPAVAHRAIVTDLLTDYRRRLAVLLEDARFKNAPSPADQRFPAAAIAPVVTTPR